MWKLSQHLQAILREEIDGKLVRVQEGAVAGLDLEGGGITARLFKKLFKLIGARGRRTRWVCCVD